MDGVGVILIFIIFIAAAFALWCWHYRRANTLLEEWAARNDYHIVSREYRWFRRGRFFWFTGRGQIVFHVEIVDSEGLLRSGLVRVGGFFLGMMSNNVEVAWDDE